MRSILNLVLPTAKFRPALSWRFSTRSRSQLRAKNASISFASAAYEKKCPRFALRVPFPGAMTRQNLVEPDDVLSRLHCFLRRSGILFQRGTDERIRRP